MWVKLAALIFTCLFGCIISGCGQINNQTTITTTTTSTSTTTSTTTTTLYSALGVIDTSFGVNGVVTGEVDSGAAKNDYAYSMLLDADGKVLITGQTTNANSNEDMVIWRYTSNGVLDPTFGTGGIVTHHNAAGGNLHDNAYWLTQDSTGKIVVSGRSENASLNYDMAVWRYDTAGVLDTTFGTNGIVVHNGAAGGNSYDSGYSITTDSSNRLLVGGGSTNASGNSDMVIWRYSANGTLDTTFGTNGIVVHSDALGVNAAERATCIAVDPSGKILAAGYGVNPQGNSDLPVWRFNSDGTVDTTFGTNGVVVHQNAAGGNGHDSGGSITVDLSGKIFIAGASQNTNNNYDMVIWKYDTNGVLDPTFGTAGIVVHNNAAGGNGDDGAGPLVIDSYGKILVTGYSVNASGNNDLAIWRYNSDGTLDTSFGTNGIVTHNNAAGGNGDDRGGAIALDASGKILVGGYSVNASGNYDIVIWKFK